MANACLVPRPLQTVLALLLALAMAGAADIPRRALAQRFAPVFLPFPQHLLRGAADLSARGILLNLSTEGPRITDGDGHKGGPYLAIVKDQRLLGWMPLHKLPPGAYRLSPWWISFDGHMLQWAMCYPETREPAQKELRRLGHTPDDRELERYVRAGLELNQDIETYVVLHRLTLEEAILRVRKERTLMLRQLVTAYFQTFALTATTLATAHALGIDPEASVQAQSRRQTTQRPPAAGSASADEGFVAPSPIPITKPKPEPTAVQAWVKQFRSEPTPTSKPHNQYEIRHTGPVNIEVRGGGEKVKADGVRYTDGYLLEAKAVTEPERSPFIPESSCFEPVRQDIHGKTDDEFRRYAAVIRDPATPVIGLEVIVSDRRALAYFLELMKQHGIPGRIIVKQ